MHPVLFIFLIICAIALVMKFVINPMIARHDGRDAQKGIDRNIEWQLLEGLEYPHQITINLLAQYSDKEKIARIMASRIREYLAIGAHPHHLAKLFESLALYDGSKKGTTREIEVAALIKHYVLEDVSRNDLSNYQSTLASDTAKGLERLNMSFIVKAKKCSFLWNPLDN